MTLQDLLIIFLPGFTALVVLVIALMRWITTHKSAYALPAAVALVTLVAGALQATGMSDPIFMCGTMFLGAFVSMAALLMTWSRDVRPAPQMPTDDLDNSLLY